jgi:hypothetical protein
MAITVRHYIAICYAIHVGFVSSLVISQSLATDSPKQPFFSGNHGFRSARRLALRKPTYPTIRIRYSSEKLAAGH